MNSKQLQDRLKEIQSHIDNFKQALIDNESHYQLSLELTTDPALRSSLMEHHIINTERQRVAMAEMERLYSQVQSHLASLEKFNL